MAQLTQPVRLAFQVELVLTATNTHYLGATRLTRGDASRYLHKMFLGALAALRVNKEVAPFDTAIRSGCCVLVTSFAHLALWERHFSHGVALWTFQRPQTKIFGLLFLFCGIFKDFRCVKYSFLLEPGNFLRRCFCLNLFGLLLSCLRVVLRFL